MVEWRAIGDICYISDYVSNGSFASLRENVQYKSEPDYAVLIRFADYSNGFDESKFVYVDEQAFHFLSKSELKSGDIIMSNVGSCGLYFICPSMDRKMSLAPNSILIRSEYNRYLNHWFGSYQGVEDIKKITSKSAMPKFNKTEFKKIQVPIPSKEEVDRIVDILDTFTSSIENLKEQIALRRKQYEYYRDQLLDLDGKEGVEMKTLGEIGEFIRGNGIQKNDFVEEGLGCIHYGQIHAKYGFSAEETISKIEEPLYKKCKKAQKGDVVLATTSEDAEGVAKPFVWLGNEKVAVSGDAFIYHHHQNGKFMGYQFLTHKFMQFKVKYATGAKVVRISGDRMAKFEVALPSLEKQNEIVDILDKFEASIQNLEAQLAQREKQYEYYRNKLLTFK